MSEWGTRDSRGLWEGEGQCLPRHRAAPTSRRSIDPCDRGGRIQRRIGIRVRRKGGERGEGGALAVRRRGRGTAHSSTDQAQRGNIIDRRDIDRPMVLIGESLRRIVRNKSPKHPHSRGIGRHLDTVITVHAREGPLLPRLFESVRDFVDVVGEVVVSHRDRLCRFAYELFEWICEKNGTTVPDAGVSSYLFHSPFAGA